MSQEFEFVGGRENAGHLERKGRRHTGGKDKDRVARVEALVEQLIRKVDRHGGVELPATSEIPTPRHGIPTPDVASIDQESPRFLSLCKPSDVRIYFFEVQYMMNCHLFLSGSWPR